MSYATSSISTGSLHTWQTTLKRGQQIENVENDGEERAARKHIEAEIHCQNKLSDLLQAHAMRRYQYL